MTAVIALIDPGFASTSSTRPRSPNSRRRKTRACIIAISFNNPTATLAQRQLYSRAVFDTFKTFPETDHVFQLDVPGQSIAGMVLKPWDERRQTATQLQPQVQHELGQIAGSQIALFQPPSLPGAFGLPVQFVITTTEPFSKRLTRSSQKFLQEAQKSGQFIFLTSPTCATTCRSRASSSTATWRRSSGCQMQDIGSALSAMLGGGYVNFFELDGRAYKVIPQVAAGQRLNPEQLRHYPAHRERRRWCRCPPCASSTPSPCRRRRSTTSSSSTRPRSRA